MYLYNIFSLTTILLFKLSLGEINQYYYINIPLVFEKIKNKMLFNKYVCISLWTRVFVSPNPTRSSYTRLIIVTRVFFIYYSIQCSVRVIR